MVIFYKEQKIRFTSRESVWLLTKEQALNTPLLQTQFGVLQNPPWIVLGLKISAGHMTAQVKTTFTRLPCRYVRL